MATSLYNVAKSFGTERKNDGFDYSSDMVLLKSTMSAYMFNNIELSDFLRFLNDGMVLSIDAIKKIRIHNNFTVPKETLYIN